MFVLGARIQVSWLGRKGLQLTCARVAGSNQTKGLEGGHTYLPNFLSKRPARDTPRVYCAVTKGSINQWHELKTFLSLALDSPGDASSTWPLYPLTVCCFRPSLPSVLLCIWATGTWDVWDFPRLLQNSCASVCLSIGVWLRCQICGQRYSVIIPLGLQSSVSFLAEFR